MYFVGRLVLPSLAFSHQKKMHVTNEKSDWLVKGCIPDAPLKFNMDTQK